MSGPNKAENSKDAISSQKSVRPSCWTHRHSGILSLYNRTSTFSRLLENPQGQQNQGATEETHLLVHRRYFIQSACTQQFCHRPKLGAPHWMQCDPGATCSGSPAQRSSFRAVQKVKKTSVQAQQALFLRTRADNPHAQPRVSSTSPTDRADGVEEQNRPSPSLINGLNVTGSPDQ